MFFIPDSKEKVSDVDSTYMKIYTWKTFLTTTNTSLVKVWEIISGSNFIL